MGWLRRLAGAEGQNPEIIGVNVILRPPELKDFSAWRDLRESSRAFLVPWEPAWPPDELSRESFQIRLRVNRAAMVDGSALPLFIFDANQGNLVGGINITNIRRGVAQTGTLGYWMGAPFAGKGHMSNSLSALINHARDELKLHRLEAACLPRNAPSTRLLARAGFEREGFARAYLKINGRWEDHILWGRLL